MNAEKYIQFPIDLLQHLIVKKDDTLNRILIYGIRNHANRIKYHPNNVANNLIYHNYKYTLPNDLVNVIESRSWEYLGRDEDYQGFNGLGEFEPNEEELGEVLQSLENDPKIKELAFEFYAISLAMKQLNVSGGIDNVIVKSGQFVIAEKTPIGNLNLKHLFDFRDKEKTEFELMEFAVFLAIHSIKGKKKIIKTNSKHIIARAIGYASIKLVPDHVLKGKLFIKYTKRYHFNKIMKSLELNWFVKSYSRANRGLYVAIGREVTYDEIIQLAESDKRKNKEKAIQRAKRLAYHRVINQIEFE